MDRPNAHNIYFIVYNNYLQLPIPYVVTYKIKYIEIPNRIRRNKTGMVVDQIMHASHDTQTFWNMYFPSRIFVNLFLYIKYI